MGQVSCSYCFCCPCFGTGRGRQRAAGRVRRWLPAPLCKTIISSCLLANCHPDLLQPRVGGERGGGETSWLLFPLLSVSVLSQNESMAQPGTPNFKGNSIHSPFLFQEFMHSGQFSWIRTMWLGKGVGSYCSYMLKSLSCISDLLRFFSLSEEADDGLKQLCSKLHWGCWPFQILLLGNAVPDLLLQKIVYGGWVVLGVHSSQIISPELTYT